MNNFVKNLTIEERKLFITLNTPVKIQDFLETLKINWSDDTCYSPRMVLKRKTAQCFEGAVFAAACLYMHGKPPLLLDLDTTDDDGDSPHVIALFKKNGRWGGISKTNHAVLRYREPVYKTVRELTMSYFHEYFLNNNGKKTLRSYSRIFDLRRYKPEHWLLSDKPLSDIMEALANSRHYPIAPKSAWKTLRPADQIERKAGRLTEWINSSKK